MIVDFWCILLSFLQVQFGALVFRPSGESGTP